ncbi:MAG TPA: GNAT family N-acetyltransferase [Nocardioidaceae bacterium]|nr:GNAT family N-acetyltransferase [Nocardioidaceae bacterium]
MTTIRAYAECDRSAVMALADRLTAGAAPWRDRERWLAVVRGWVAESIDAADYPLHSLLVAADDDTDAVIGFVALSTRTHFTGDVHAYIGELVVDHRAERRGVGRRLLQAAECWALEHGFDSITLDTGAANTAARALYASAGYADEDIRLIKRLA